MDLPAESLKTFRFRKSGMISTWTLGIFLLPVLLLWSPGSARAGKRRFVVCLPLGEGSAAQATRHMQPFLRHLEKSAGWEENSVVGTYINSLPECLAYIEKNKPHFGVISQGLYLSNHRKWSLDVIGRVDMPRGAGRRLHLVVEKGKYDSLEGLKGVVLRSNHVADTEFLNRIVFNRKIDVASHFKLDPTSSPLSGIRSVFRGRVGATLVNDDELELMRKRKEGEKLEVLMSSRALPGTPVVAFKNNADAKDVRTLAKILGNLCKGAGKSVCRDTMIRNFTSANNAVYAKLRNLYR